MTRVAIVEKEVSGKIKTERDLTILDTGLNKFIIFPYEEPWITLSRIQKHVEKKNKMYGNSWRDLGFLGMAYRIKDKCNRMINMIIKRHELSVIKEDIKEEIWDIAGYVILMIKNYNEGGKWW